MRRVVALLLFVLPTAAQALDVAQPGSEEGAWSKYDFIPGDKLLVFEDFTGGAKKTNPMKRFTAVSARMDIQDRSGGKWLHCRPPCSFDVILPEKLPSRFTVDFDLYGPGAGANGMLFEVVNADGSRMESPLVASSSNSSMGCGEHNNEIDRLVDGQSAQHISWSFDGANAKGYVGRLPGLNAPDVPSHRSARMHFEFVGGDDPGLIDQNVPTWMTNLRIATGGNTLTFEELVKKGRLVLQGILFDSGSDRIRPESTPTLTQVGKILSEHPELKLVVEGHTDNQGAAPANLTLSGKRAEAVKAWLVTKHKIDGARLTPKGFGQTRPVGSNDTAEGRQANRRVELARP